MAGFRSVIFRNSVNTFFRQNIGGHKIYMLGASKSTQAIQANGGILANDLNEKSNSKFGELKLNQTSMKTNDGLPRLFSDIASLVEDDIKHIFYDIRKEFESRTNSSELLSMANFYFDGTGKAIRPIIATLMGKSLNFHISNGKKTSLSPCQRLVAMISEMTHGASLMHDDLLDGEDWRRGKPSMTSLNRQKVARAGDFVMGTISSLIARLNYDAGMILQKMARDMTTGELLQLDSAMTENEDMFSSYLKVIHLKAAVLFASSCEAQAVLAGADYFLRERALQYGRNIGMAFQLTDDYKDFEYDLSQGVVTAPVLLACKKYPELHELILRKFSEKNDLAKAFDFVFKAQGLQETKKLVRRHCNNAIQHASIICESPYQDGLKYISEKISEVIYE